MAESTPLRFIGPAEAVAGHVAGSTTIVDVRQPEEWESSHVKNAVHVPLANFLDKEKLDVVIKEQIAKIEGQVCLTCFQSQKRGPAAAAALIARLQEQGVDTSRVSVLEGGLEAVQQDSSLHTHLEGKDPVPASPAAH